MEQSPKRVPDPPQEARLPGWLLVPLAGAAGWIMSDPRWMGMAFGAFVGFLIWRARG